MKKICKDSFAKINLSLDVLEQRIDGYHNIDTIMQLVDLKDTIEMENSNDNHCHIICDNPSIPTDHNNLVYRAWKNIIDYCNIDRGVHIHINKNIPVAAGLAGGSSNAASVMSGLSELWELNLSTEELMEIGTKIGADVPYFFEGEIVRATGIGNQFQKISKIQNYPILLVNNGLEISTKEVYGKIKSSKFSTIDKVVEAIEDDNLLDLAKFSYNTMEKVVFKDHPEIGRIKDELKSYGADVSLMSGSGATVFGLFRTPEKLEKVYQQMKYEYKYVIKSTLL